MMTTSSWPCDPSDPARLAMFGLYPFKPCRIAETLGMNLIFLWRFPGGHGDTSHHPVVMDDHDSSLMLLPWDGLAKF